MPIYEFKCEHCGNEFEVLMLDKDKIRCNKCGNICKNKILSKSNFILKGSGWGKDGYSKK